MAGWGAPDLQHDCGEKITIGDIRLPFWAITVILAGVHLADSQESDEMNSMRFFPTS